MLRDLPWPQQQEILSELKQGLAANSLRNPSGFVVKAVLGMKKGGALPTNTGSFAPIRSAGALGRAVAAVAWPPGPGGAAAAAAAAACGFDFVVDPRERLEPQQQPAASSSR